MDFSPEMQELLLYLMQEAWLRKKVQKKRHIYCSQQAKYRNNLVCCRVIHLM